MNKSVVLDLIDLLRMASIALAVTAGLGFLVFWMTGQVLPVFRFSAAFLFLPWITGGVLGAVWMTVLRLLIRRTTFASSTT